MKMMLVLILTGLTLLGHASAQDAGFRRDEERPRSVRVLTGNTVREERHEITPDQLYEVWRFFNHDGAPFKNIVLVRSPVPALRGQTCVDLERQHVPGPINPVPPPVPPVVPPFSPTEADALLSGKSVRLNLTDQSFSLPFSVEESAKYLRLRGSSVPAPSIYVCYKAASAASLVKEFSLTSSIGLDVYDRKSIDILIGELRAHLQDLTESVMSLPGKPEFAQAVAKEIVSSDVLIKRLLSDPAISDEISSAVVSALRAQKSAPSSTK